MRSLKKRGPNVLDDLMTSYFSYIFMTEICILRRAFYRFSEPELCHIKPTGVKHFKIYLHTFIEPTVSVAKFDGKKIIG